MPHFYQTQDFLLLMFATFWILVWIFVRILHLLAILYGKWRLHQKRKIGINTLEHSVPGVSILKPVCESDDDCLLFSNLETFFTLEYPGQFEIIFCVQDASDIISGYIKELKSMYPKVDTQVFVGGKNVGVNPKINNMYPGFTASKYELILVSDSRIRMEKDTLVNMVSDMTENVGLVHQMPFTCDQSGENRSVATLEKIHFGTSFARMYLVANFIGLNCAVGMSELIRKSILEDSGGLKSFGKYLAEDFFFAQAVLDSGHKICISSEPAWQNSRLKSIATFQNRVTRWTKLRTVMCPFTTFCEPFSECMLLGILATCSALIVFQWDPTSVFFIHILVWFLMDWVLLLVVQNGTLPFNKFEFLVMWMYREVTLPYLYVISLLHRDIKWGTKRFRLKFGGIAELNEEEVQVPQKSKILPEQTIISTFLNEFKSQKPLLNSG